MGQKIAKVRYGSQERQLPLIVVAGDGPSLLDRNWLGELQLDLGRINNVVAPLEQLLQEYEEVFRPELGTLGHPGQVVLEPSSRKYVTISTRKGLYQYNSYLLGLRQHLLSSRKLLQGIPGGGWYIRY